MADAAPAGGYLLATLAINGLRFLLKRSPTGARARFLGGSMRSVLRNLLSSRISAIAPVDDSQIDHPHYGPVAIVLSAPFYYCTEPGLAMWSMPVQNENLVGK